MAEPRETTNNLSGNGVILLLLAVAGTYFVTHQISLDEGIRPTSTEISIHEVGRAQDVDSRLWQDPFTVVAEQLEKSPELRLTTSINNDLRISDPHFNSPLSHFTGEPPLVLVASVSAGPYSEDHEFRRRTRYAILAGLNEEGFVAEDPQHVGYYRPTPATSGQVELPEFVPFEWFTSGTDPQRHILLVWFDEDVLTKFPLKQFRQFICWYLAPVAEGHPAPWSSAIVLGPQQSTTLRNKAHEDDRDWSNVPCQDAPRPEFYVYTATAEDKMLMPETAKLEPTCPATDTLTDFFSRRKQVTLYRTTASDAALVCTIKHELGLRRIVNKFNANPDDHIVLISEWDTFYGQALPISMSGCLATDQELAIDGNEKCMTIISTHFYRYAYLRGLDGQVPHVGRLANNDAPQGISRTQNTANKDAKNSTIPDSSIKPRSQADGQSQFDYLRRLGDQIHDIDMTLWREEGKGIEAIGILGSDRYDKLLVLQALRSLLPTAVYFTTDLDALYLEPTLLSYTRNLLIASSFGLQLNPNIQRSIPPFRSSYQTAGFLATRYAIQGVESPPISPLLFEVGNSPHPFQFPYQAKRDSSQG
jgi:hypothetical protein